MSTSPKSNQVRPSSPTDSQGSAQKRDGEGNGDLKEGKANQTYHYGFKFNDQIKQELCKTKLAEAHNQGYKATHTNKGQWSEEEHEKFLEALKTFGKDWKKVEQHIGTRTSCQARSHAQKYFGKYLELVTKGHRQKKLFRGLSTDSQSQTMLQEKDQLEFENLLNGGQLDQQIGSNDLEDSIFQNIYQDSTFQHVEQLKQKEPEKRVSAPQIVITDVDLSSDSGVSRQQSGQDQVINNASTQNGSKVLNIMETYKEIHNKFITYGSKAACIFHVQKPKISPRTKKSQMAQEVGQKGRPKNETARATKSSFKTEIMNTQSASQKGKEEIQQNQTLKILDLEVSTSLDIPMKSPSESLTLTKDNLQTPKKRKRDQELTMELEMINEHLEKKVLLNDEAKDERMEIDRSHNSSSQSPLKGTLSQKKRDSKQNRKIHFKLESQLDKEEEKDNPGSEKEAFIKFNPYGNLSLRSTDVDLEFRSSLLDNSPKSQAGSKSMRTARHEQLEALWDCNCFAPSSPKPGLFDFQPSLSNAFDFCDHNEIKKGDLQNEWWAFNSKLPTESFPEMRPDLFLRSNNTELMEDELGAFKQMFEIDSLIREESWQ